MIIGIDIRVLGSPVKSGIEEYTENLLAHLTAIDSGIKFKLFFSSLTGNLPEYEWLGYKNVEFYKYKFPNKLLFASSGLFRLPKIDRLIGGADVFFSPHFFLAPVSEKCRQVTTFHDLSFVHFPEFFSLRKNIWHNLEMRPLRQSHFADRIIAVSASTKNDLVKLYDVDPAKVEVIHSGISENVRRPSNYDLSQFKIDNNVPDSFMLYVGKLEPRKNIVAIVKAFNILKNQKEYAKLCLVLVGSKGWLFDDIFDEIKKSPYRQNIIIRDHVKDSDRKFYYSLASVFVYPSFFEGFGFPPLEAMACGTPVICSNNSALSEIAGAGAITVDAENVGDIARSISNVLTDKKLKTRLYQSGTTNTFNYSWRVTAEKTLACLLK